MNVSLTRTGGLLALIGGGASLIGFVLLPFGVDPLRFVPENGLLLLQTCAQQVSEANTLFGHRLIDHHLYDPLIVSYASLWAIFVFFILLTLLSFLLVILRKSSIVLPILCLVLSIFAAPGFFLAFSQFTTDSRAKNLLQLMFTDSFPIIRVGWWVSLGGVFLLLIASVLVIIGRSQASRP